MLEILYRIYKVAENDEFYNENNDDDIHLYESISNTKNIELAMECLICETRDAFKDIIRDLYGKDIRFTYSKKLEPGDIYCVIIGEHCWNTEKYFTRYDFECDCCHTKFHSYINAPFKFSSSEISWDLLNQVDKYKDKTFCSWQCKDRYLALEKTKIANESDGLNVWANRGDFKSNKVAGYVYKITKKSTGEFYIGQTIYEPMFRWAQHLSTERFKIDNILDYQYETIEIVPYGENILEREKYWIQKYYKENPSLSLNIMQTANLVPDKNQLSLDLEEINNEKNSNG